MATGVAGMAVVADVSSYFPFCERPAADCYFSDCLQGLPLEVLTLRWFQMVVIATGAVEAGSGAAAAVSSPHVLFPCSSCALLRLLRFQISLRSSALTFGVA